MIETLINGRWALHLPEHRQQQWRDGQWERARLEHMFSTTRDGDKVLYIGAEEGDMPALLSSWGAELFLIEPGVRVWANIKAIWDANELTPPQGNFVGFCGKENSANWVNGWNKDWPENSYGDIICDHAFPSVLTAGDSPTITVDQITGKFTPDVISIDVEGAEWDVLRGAEHTIAEVRPRIYLSLHPEFVFHQYGVYGKDVRDLIRDQRYRETLIAYEHEAHFYYEPL